MSVITPAGTYYQKCHRKTKCYAVFYSSSPNLLGNLYWRFEEQKSSIDNLNRNIVEEILAKMASRVGNCLQLRVIKTYKNLNHRNFIATTFNQIRQLSKTSSPSPSGNFQLSHLNPAVIEKIEKQIATQGIAIHRLKIGIP